MKRFEDLGLDELISDPTIGELDQVDRLADALLQGRSGDPGTREGVKPFSPLPAGA